MRIDKKLRQKQERMKEDKKSRRKKRQKKKKKGGEESDTLTEELSDSSFMVRHIHTDLHGASRPH